MVSKARITFLFLGDRPPRAFPVIECPALLAGALLPLLSKLQETRIGQLPFSYSAPLSFLALFSCICISALYVVLILVILALLASSLFHDFLGIA